MKRGMIVKLVENIGSNLLIPGVLVSIERNISDEILVIKNPRLSDDAYLAPIGSVIPATDREILYFYQKPN